MIFLTEEMFMSGQPVAQGEVNIWMKKYAPPTVLDATANLQLSAMNFEDDKLIVGHSETGHHHVIETVDGAHVSNVVTALIDSANDTFMFLYAKDKFKLTHLRSNDTHKPLVLPAGEYIRGIREEQTVEGWRRVAD